MQIIGVYHAYSGLMGELKYITGKLLGTTACALCDITHGWQPLGKAQWRHEMKQWGNLKALHIDEQSPQMAAITDGQTPCILIANEDDYEIIIDSEQLAACEGDIQALLTLIKSHVGK
jgi:hypothetical protein